MGVRGRGDEAEEETENKEPLQNACGKPQPGEGGTPPEDGPDEGDSQPGDRPGQGETQPEDTPDEGDTQPGDRPGVKEDCLQRRPSPRGVEAPPCPERDRERRVEEPKGSGPFYFFGGSNGAPIVTSYCESRGWRRIYDKNREDFKLKWSETRSPAQNHSFREGEQLLYQIPNNKVLTTKIGLLSSLREYERVSSKVNHGRGLRRLKMKDFFPATFRLDLRDEREAFFAQQEGLSAKESNVWICKPTGLNQGKGIFLLKTQDEIAALKQKLQFDEDNQSMQKMPFRLPQARIVQRYVQNPLLLVGRKFDVRSYFLIACTAPYMVFFRHGYVRLTCDLYDPNSNNLSAHLTNQYMQKKNPLYSLLKEETVWSMERFNTYVNENLAVAKGLPRDWVLGAFAKRMQQIMTQCFFAVKSKLACKLGFFDLIGCDFMIDEDFKVWLLEMNCNPALHTNCEVLKEVIPTTVVETLDIALEIFNKCRCGLRIFPLTSQKDFLLLFNGEPPTSPVAAQSKTRTAGIGRIQRPISASPTKKPSKKTAAKEDVVTRVKSGRKSKGCPASTTTSDISVTRTEHVTGKEEDSSSSLSTTTNDSLSKQAASTSSSVPSKPPGLPKPSDPSKPSRRPPKSPRSRVELRLGKCTWHQRSRNVHPEVLSLSSPALTDVTRLGERRPQGSEVTRGGQPYSSTLRPNYFRLTRPQSGGNEPVDKQQRREELKERTKDRGL
ncbi:protein polyglycylase TTLL10 [Aplochiton taeniatus]